MFFSDWLKKKKSTVSDLQELKEIHTVDYSLCRKHHLREVGDQEVVPAECVAMQHQD